MTRLHSKGGPDLLVTHGTTLAVAAGRDFKGKISPAIYVAAFALCIFVA